ncbi:proline dehydrogenase family protein [Jejuia pallidilutea]|uniref:Carbapenem antibiotics biosynthesis protein carD n=2 Tax=Jejuia pallidilutea TaxID=504487 RepID=A0A090W190_9FLAO|nr:proline dehydrogenase family protein [Jejuia pallidilutea]GAL70785.1 carbapenem antibiotics biosynthesis protein carD [Jejuia pallidilutea]GAL90645.1 carbapenem antibiotics biosynthesis protein carD [Jejuia pallidilutea]
MINRNTFDDTKIAFSLKNDSELERAYFLFKMISVEPLVRIGKVATNFAIKANLPIEGLIRATVFDHFCGGVNEEDCLPVINKMYEKGVSSVLDYSVEGKESEKEFDNALKTVLNIIEFAKALDAIPIAVFKPSGFGRFKLYEKKNNGVDLNADEIKEWERVEARFEAVCKKAKAYDVAVLIDAEESWIQDAVDALVTKMMKIYNTEKPIVFNTLQMYRHDRMAFLKKEHAMAKTEGYYLGYKLVRGAYMEKENDRAKEKKYESPICKSKQATDENFNDALQYMINHLDCMSIFAGTHNENSSYLLMELMEEKHILNNDPRIWFGQLYGMSDHISFNLSHLGYNVAKYMPFGPVKDVMPYLIRRAEENTSVAGQTGRELALIKKEKERRKNA